MDTTISSVRTASDRDPDCQSLASCVSITVSCASYADVTVAAHHHDSTHDGSASEASYIQKLWPAPKKLCLLGNLTAENAPLCLKTLHLPFAENVLINGKLPADSSGVLIFVVDEDEFESPIVSYLGDVMTEQNSMLSSSLPCPVLESPGIVRLVSVKVLDDLSSRLPSPEEVIREVISFKRPVLSLALLKDRFVFTGFTSKDYVRYLTKLVHRMGGSVMQDTDSSTTHLIAKKACGPKYHYCKIFNVPVLKKEWVEDLWDAAKTSTPAPVEMDKYFCPLFFELRVGFVGFSKEKLSEIQACLEQNGGKMTRPDAERVDFIVVNEPAMQDTPLPALNPKAALVTEAWFWESVVKGRVLMDEFRYKVPLRPDMSCKSPSVESSRSSDTVVPGPAFAGSGKARRRSFLNLKSEKRKKEELGRSPAKTDTSVDTDSTLKVEETNDTESVDALNSQRSMGKLTSKRSLLNGADQSVGSVGDINLTSESVGSMDHSSSSLLSPTPIDSTPKVPTARRQVFWELLQTEKNYVQVLDLIMRAGTDWRQQEAEMVAKKRHSHAQKENVVEGGFKVPGNVSLHVSSSREKDFVSGHGSLHTSLLDTSHSDPDIFDARILDMLLATITPLQKVHTRLLATLQTLEASWDENSRVGLAIASELGREDFINAYKNYVKDVDQVKAELKKLSSTYPRFHAYLRAVQLKPEYRRQGLDELLIRPIQRLPSMILLLKDLWKRTAAHLYDYLELVRALELAEMITSRTNDERRMYEKQRGIMRLIYEIEDCPPDILSWSTGRQLIANFDVVDLNNCTGKRGSPLVIFFLTDVLMICKKRSSKILGSSILRSSPSVNSLHSEAGVEGVINSGQKPYRFVCWLELRYVKVLLDLRYSGKDQDLSHLVQDGSFGLCIQRDGELDQTNYAFHVFRGGTVSDMCGGPPQSPSVTLERNTPPSVIAGGGVGNGMSGNGLAASGALGSTLSLSEIAVSKAEGPKQELLRLLTENVVRQTFQDPSCLVQSAEITQVNVDPHQYPRLVSGSNSSNPFHRMTRKMSFRTGGNSNSGPTTPLKRSYSTITPSSAGPHLGSQAPAMQSDVTSSLKKPTTASFTDGKDEREEFLAPLPPSNSFAKPSPFKKTTSSSSFKKQFSRLTQFAFSRTSSASNTSSSSMSPGAATNSPSSEKRKA